MMKYIRPFWISIFLLFAAFLLGYGINAILEVPAEGIKRIYAFTLFLFLFGLKIKTWFED